MSPVHVVRQGECLSSIALRYGFRNWQSLYYHPDNSALRRRRPNPDTLHPGDEIVIPERESRTESAETDRRHRFRLHAPRARLRLQLKNRWGAPLAQYRYNLRVGQQNIEGTTDSDGNLEADIPADAAEGELTAWLAAKGDRSGPSHTWRLQLGSLDPDDEISGVQGRLINLGYPIDRADGTMGPATRKALMEFQARNRLPITGRIDDQTRRELKRQHHDT